MNPELEKQLSENASNSATHNNEYEKTISLQLISLATFIVTFIGAFISIKAPINLNVGVKTVIVIELIILFASMIFGIVHLLITRQMFSRSFHNFNKALDLIQKNPSAINSIESLEAIVGEKQPTTMAFFYAQICTLLISLATFIGLIIFILYQ